jgi:hypothetical protein
LGSPTGKSTWRSPPASTRSSSPPPPTPSPAVLLGQLDGEPVATAHGVSTTTATAACVNAG